MPPNHTSCQPATVVRILVSYRVDLRDDISARALLSLDLHLSAEVLLGVHRLDVRR